MLRKILNFIDNFLNRITMYRLVLYFLIVLWAVGFALSFLNILPFKPLTLIFGTAVILAFSLLANEIFAGIFKAQTNTESVYITALILSLIITPPLSTDYFSNFALLFWASVWAMAAKYIFAINKKHLFNPAAFGVALAALTINQSASWWVGGNVWLLPFVFLGGLLVVRKLQRADMIYGFLVAACVSIMVLAGPGINPFSEIFKAFLHSPILFFAFVMLTEPLTTPPTRSRQVFYGIFTGLLFGPNVHIGSIYSTPELALLCGNIFSYFLSPKSKYVLRFVQKIQVTPDVFDFVFESDRPFKFKPGQYLEWTIGHKKTDSRGNRRYFTLASSPTEEFPRLGVRFYPESSSFKKALMALDKNREIVAGQLAGDFTLPRDKDKKLVFLAGGIGITPFRSMAKYLLDKQERRDIVLFYSSRNADDIAYWEVFKAAEKIGLRSFYTLTEPQNIPAGWPGERGAITEEKIKRLIPDYKERVFYLSGPRAMVVAFEEVLKSMGIRKSHLKTDFFPGFV